MRKAKLNERGHELLDPTPLELPVGFKRPESLEEQIRRLVRVNISRQAEQEGYETFEDADDFDVGEDEDPRTPFEMDFDPILGREISPDMIRRDPVRFRDQYVEAAAESPDTEARIERETKKRSWWPRRRRDEQNDRQEAGRRRDGGDQVREARRPTADEDQAPDRRDSH